MKKYVLFLVLLLSLITTSAQEVATIKAPALQHAKWDEQELYVNGFARVLQNNKFSFINKAGQLISPVQFDAARNFIHHLAAVQKDNKWGFIDESGKVVIPFKYDIAFDFNETVTGVFGNKRWWLINTQAQVIKALDVNIFYGFKNGIAKIEKNERTGTINTNGEITFSKEQNTPQVFKNPIPYHPSLNGLTSSITACPDNIDFEYGSFFNWQCFTGHVDSIVNVNVITLTPSPPTPNRHTLFNRVTPSAIDPYGLFPTNPPDGSNFALKLGNTLIGGEAEGATYVIHVPLNDSNFAIKYDYAVVFQNPNHTLWSQPRFQVNVFDSAANAYVTCASFEYVSTANLPGFAVSTVDTSVIYKPWSSVFLSLRGYAGKTMYLEFKNADCVRKGHWGYSYIDVEKPCGQSVEMDYDCAPPHITTLNAPPGFQFYNWWDSAFTTILATGQNAVLNPGPAVNTTIWLEMIPFNNFGCLDTIPVKITGEFKAHFTLSDTLGLCAPHTFTFYNSDIPSTSAIWDFGDGTTGSGDTVTHTYALPGSYIVKLNVALPGGCLGVVEKLVSVVQPAGSFSFAGGNYCNTSTVQFNAISSNADSLIWNFGDGIIVHTPATQTTISHTYATAGIYHPSMTIKALGGCQTPVPATDTIKIEIIDAGFTSNQVMTCGSTTLNLSDTSHAFFGIASRQWDFGDGTTGSGINVSHVYTTTGTYTVRLIVTGTSGCKDSAIKPIIITVHSKPVASINGNTVDCQFVPVAFTSTVVSADPVNYYKWTSSNGSSSILSTFTVIFSQAGIDTVQLIVRTVNGCADTVVHYITINPVPNVVQPPNQVLCNNDFTVPVNFSGSVPGTIYNWINTAPLIGLAASGSGDIASFQASSNGNSVANAVVRVTPTANGCPGTYKTFIITVYPTPYVTQPADQTLCNNSNTAAINFGGPVAGTVYNWTNSNTTIGLGTSGTGNIPSFTASSNGAAINTATITVTPTVNGCPGAPKTFSITVNPMPDVVQPADQVLCNNNFTSPINFTGPVTGTVYSWTNSNPSIGLAANGTGNIASFAAIASSTTATATITVTPSLTGCTAPSKTFTITVNPTPSVVQPTDQTLCDNSNTTAINFSGTVGGTVYNWTNSNTTIGLSASGTGNIPSFTASSNGAAINTATITVTPMANGCPGTPKTFTISVNPMPDVVQPADQSICSGNFTSPINFTGTVTGTLYSWTNSNPSIGLAANGTGNIASFAAIASSTTATATITVTASINGCSAPSKTFTITVNPTPNVVQPTDQTLCDNSNTTAINFSGTVGGTVYNWTNSNTTIGLSASGTGNIPSFTASSNGAAVNTATITVTPTVNGCPGVTKTFSITVNPMPDVVQPADQSLCSGNFTSPINFTGPVAGTIYSWTNNNTAIGLAASGTGNIASFAASSNGTSAATAIITVTPSIGGGCTAPSKTFSITVNPTPNVVQPTDQTLCDNSNTTAINFSGAVAGTVYNWTNSNATIGLSASGTGNIPSFTASSNGATINSATITVTPTFNGCPGTPKTFTITVNPMPDVVQPADQSLCSGNFTTPVNFTGPVAGTIYSWTNNNTVIGLAASGTGNIASFAASSNGTSAATAIITVTPSISGSCTAPSKTFTITVNPTPNVVQPTDQTLCDNSNTTAINFSGAVAGTVYNWTNSNATIGLSASGTGNIPSFTASSNGATTNSATITVTPTFNGCPGTPKTFTITVDPKPGIVQPNDQALCNGSYTLPINFTGPVNGTVYTWTNTAPTIGLAANGTGNIPSFQAFGPATTMANATITVNATANGCTAPPKTFVITVNPIPTLAQPGNQVVCNGAVINPIAFAGNISSAVYSWTNNNPLIGLPASGSGDIASFTGVNNTALPITATITVLPATATCSGTPKTFTIIINPTPAVVAKNSTEVCLGKTVQLTASGAAQYVWTPVDHLTCSNCASPVAKPVDSIIYRVKGTSSFGCDAYDSVLLSVIKPFQMQVSPNDTLCIGETTSISAANAASYLWSPPTWLSRTNIANPKAGTLVTTKYQVIGFDGHNCFTDTGYVLITVGPRPTVNLGPDRVLSTGTPLTLNAITTNGPIIRYEWTPAQELSCNNCVSPNTIVRNNGFYTVEVTNTFGCKAADTLIINSICKSAQVFVPNAFTPDGDGLNDILMVRGRGITIKSFRIFNRWGEVVFEKQNFYPDDPKFGWDGRVRGVPATPDVFVYTLEVFCDNGIPFTYKGNITILK